MASDTDCGMRQSGEGATDGGEEEQRVAQFLLNHPKFVEKYLLNVADGGGQFTLASITKNLQHLCQNDVSSSPATCTNGKQQEPCGEAEIYVSKIGNETETSPTTANESGTECSSNSTKGMYTFRSA